MEDNKGEDKKKKNNKKKKSLPKLILSFLILIIVCIGIYKVVDKYMPNFEQISAQEAFPEWSNDGIMIILEDTPIKSDNPAIEENEEIYLPVEFVKNYIDKYIFWEPDSQKLTMTTENKVIKMKTDDLTAYVNNNVLTLDLPIELKNNTAYMPKILLKSLYENIEINYMADSNIVKVDFTDRAKSSGTITSKKVPMRVEANIKSPILKKLEKAEEVTVYEQGDKWTKIRTQSGIVGYIPSKRINNINPIPVEEKKVELKTEVWKPKDGKINLVWDMVTNVESSVNPSRLKVEKGLDIMSPTWFEIADEKGNIKNIANPVYVEWAHNHGYKVWALFGNKFEGQFDSEMTHKVLTNSEARENMIKQLLALTAMYDLDGINIDIESMKAEDSDYYLQFIRELTPFLRQQGVIVSVDVTVPESFSQYYQRDEVAKIVDYMIIMAYDEHWATSPKSGSVASLNWVRRGIENSLKEPIPSEKLILGIPYYCRLWIETPNKQGGIDLKRPVPTYGMDGVKKLLANEKVTPVWDEEAGQYYAEYKKDNSTYKIWVEDERSIEEKLKLVKEYDLAGIAGWQRMFTSDEVWNTLYENLKQ